MQAQGYHRRGVRPGVPMVGRGVNPRVSTQGVPVKGNPEHRRAQGSQPRPLPQCWLPALRHEGRRCALSACSTCTRTPEPNDGAAADALRVAACSSAVSWGAAGGRAARFVSGPQSTLQSALFERPLR